VAPCAPCVLHWRPRRRFPRKVAERPAEAENHAASQDVNDYCDAEDYPEFSPLAGIVRKKGGGEGGLPNGTVEDGDTQELPFARNPAPECCAAVNVYSFVVLYE